MKIPTPPDNLTQLYGNLATALNALQDAGEHPLRGSAVFEDGTRGTTGENGQVRFSDGIWTARIDYNDLLHHADGSHRDAPDRASATFSTVVAAFNDQLPKHLAEHERDDS